MAADYKITAQQTDP